MKLNLTVKTTKNYQTIELSAADIEVSKYPETKTWLIREAQVAINQLVPGENFSQKPSVVVYEDKVETQTTDYEPATQHKGAMASQKQINFLRALGYNGDTTNLSVSEANELIKQMKTK